MTEPGKRTGERQLELAASRQIALPGDAAQSQDHPHPPQQDQFPAQVRQTGLFLLGGGSVLGRDTAHGSRNERVDQSKTVLAVKAGRLITEAGAVESRIEKLTASVTGEHAPCAIGAVCTWCQADEQQTSLGVTKRRHRTAPVFPIPVGPAFFYRHSLAIVHQPGTKTTLHNLLLQHSQFQFCFPIILNILSIHMNTTRWFTPLLVLLSLTSVDVAAERTCVREEVEAGQFAAHPVPHAQTLKIVSLNVHEEQSLDVIAEGLQQIGEIFDSDIFLLQEIAENPGAGENLLARVAERLQLNYVQAIAERLRHGGNHGLAVLSRYPLRDPEVIYLKRINVKINNRCRIALGATVDTDLGALRVFSTHLDTNINAGRRWEQIEPTAAAAGKFNGATLIGGDLNTVNIYWVENLLPLPFFHRQGRKIREQFEKLGFSTPFTGTGRTHSWAPLKLDWIYLRDLETVQRGTTGVGFSDHRALWVEVKF